MAVIRRLSLFPMLTQIFINDARNSIYFNITKIFDNGNEPNQLIHKIYDKIN